MYPVHCVHAPQDWDSTAGIGYLSFLGYARARTSTNEVGGGGILGKGSCSYLFFQPRVDRGSLKKALVMIDLPKRQECLL